MQNNILIIARKELLSTFRQRNLLLIMILSPIVLVTIIGLAFGGLAGSGTPQFADIRVAVVNQDAGFQLQAQLPVSMTTENMNTESLSAWVLDIGGQEIRLGDLLLQNPDLPLDNPLESGDSGLGELNFGDQLASILLSQPISATGAMSDGVGAFDLSSLTCPLWVDESQPVSDTTASLMAVGSLDGLLDAVAVRDVEVARAGVMRGDYVAAVIIPPDFTMGLVPLLGASDTASNTASNTHAVEIYANDGSPISASIVRAVVEGIVTQFVRVNVALNAVILTAADRVAQVETLDIGALNLDMGVVTSTLQQVDASVLAPLGCVVLPGSGPVQVVQQPLNEVQTRGTFSILMVILGSSQAIFFALFTGVFGINSIYEDRQQGTLQRVLVSPTPSGQVLWGRLLGNLGVVMSQLLILLAAFTLIASLGEAKPVFIWGNNVPVLLLVVLGISLFTTGMGVFLVGIASSSEMVQLIGPIVTLFLGALGGAFGSLVPPSFARYAPTWWAVDAMQKLAEGQGNLVPNLLVLYGAGLFLAVTGTFLFRRRMGL